MATTPNRGYELPERLDLKVSYDRIVAAFGDIDADVAQAFAALALRAAINSPAFTGTPIGPTPASGDNSTRLATTAFVAAAVAGFSPSIVDAESLVGTIDDARLSFQVSAFIRTLLDDNSAAAARTTLGIDAGRLGLVAKSITDWNDALDNGWYMGNGAANGPPASGGWYLGNVESHGSSGWRTQTVHQFTGDGAADTRTYRRAHNTGVWEDWYKLQLSQAEQDARYAAIAHAHTFASLTAKPTTLAGYGITDFAAAAIAAGGGAPDAVLEDQKASGTEGGDFTSGVWLPRDLNTKVRDPAGLITLAANSFTPSVNGWVEWEAPAIACARHRTRLFNVTDGVFVTNGTSAYSNDNSNVTVSSGGGPVSAGKTYRIEHICSVTHNITGLGVASNLATETYARVKYWRTQ